MQLVNETETADDPSPTANAVAASAAMSLIIKALQVLSQRTVIALANLFDLALCASVFFLAYQITNDPKPLQLMSVGGYAFFVLLVLFQRRR
jgi:asparagine N-glycosylation enzyme membrane subunit Stt3